MKHQTHNGIVDRELFTEKVLVSSWYIYGDMELIVYIPYFTLSKMFSCKKKI